MMKQNWRFIEKIPLTGKVSKNYSERTHQLSEPRLVCTFREIWLTGNRQSRALFTGQKKQNFRKLSPCGFCTDRAQNLYCTIYSEFPKFHLNPFTSSGVIAELVNIVDTRHILFPILGEASLSSKNLFSSNIFSKCPHTMVNFGPLTAEIGSVIWGTPPTVNGFRVLAAVLHGTSVLGVSQTLPRSTEGAVYIRQGGHHVGHCPTF